jgi:hypothetical protein
MEGSTSTGRARPSSSKPHSKRTVPPWDGRWPRWAPAQQILLCEPCWNFSHDTKRLKYCHRGGCQCPCTELAAPSTRKTRFTQKRLEAQGQTTISMRDALTITPES